MISKFIYSDYPINYLCKIAKCEECIEKKNKVLHLKGKKNLIVKSFFIIESLNQLSFENLS